MYIQSDIQDSSIKSFYQLIIINYLVTLWLPIMWCSGRTAIKSFYQLIINYLVTLWLPIMWCSGQTAIKSFYQLIINYLVTLLLPIMCYSGRTAIKSFYQLIINYLLTLWLPIMCCSGQTAIKSFYQLIINYLETLWLPIMCCSGRTASLRLLLKAGGKLDAVDKFGAMPLHYAATNNHKDCVLLVKIVVISTCLYKQPFFLTPDNYFLPVEGF